MAVPVPLLTVSSSRRPAPSLAAAALVLVGLTAIVGQIVLLRELIVVFNGNEISLGIMLGTWLLWTAAGSGLASRLAFSDVAARRGTALLECLLAFTLPLTIWAVRVSKPFFQTVPGELIGPVPMLLTCLSCLSIFCLFSGCSFVFAGRMYQQSAEVAASQASSSAYLLEAVGSALGGIIASFVLLRFLDSFQIAVLVAVLNLSVAALLVFGVRRRTAVAIVLAAAMLSVPLLRYGAPFLLRSSQERLWRGFRLLESRDSIYGNLSVIETGNIRSIYDNGVILASAPDPAAAEEAVHYALLEHPEPQTVLLIGGGTNGSVAEVLKHPTIERLDYVELDPMLISLGRRFFPAQSAPLMGDNRVHVHYADGRFYLGTTRDRFDVIILALPDPQTAQLNRFYTVEFFQSARKHLMPEGLLGLQLRASEDYISPALAEFLRCIDGSLREVFPYVSVIPGESMHFFAATRPDVLTDDPMELIARLQARKLQTRYVREYFIPFRMMPDRMEQIRRSLQPTATTPINRDFEPIAYYFDVTLWSAQFKSSFNRWFQEAAQLEYTHLLGGLTIILFLLCLFLAYVPARERRPAVAAGSCIAAAGFTVMVLQLLVLLAFESIYGYVYHQLAILLGMFMAGIAIGTRIGLHLTRENDHKKAPRAMTITQVLLLVAAPTLLLVITLLSHVSNSPGMLVAAQLAFPALALLCGLLGGLQFSITSRVYLRDGQSPKGLGFLYALDLLGGCVGALLLSSYLIPVFGFWNTAWLSAVVNLPAVFLAVRVSLERRMTPA